MDQVGDLYGLLSLCRLRQSSPDIDAALEAAEAGRARLLAEALAGAARQDRGRRRNQVALTASAIRAAVPKGGALVLPVLTDIGAFAFVLTRNGEIVLEEELLGLDGAEARAHLFGKGNWQQAYRHAMRTPGWSRFCPNAVSMRPDYRRWNDQLGVTQAWLWKKLLGPVDRFLRETAKLSSAAHIVILPPGLFGVLPLHAAGPGRDGLYFCDHWTVSQIPSIRTLLACRQRAAERRALPVRLLAVIDPSDKAPLPGARAEAAAIKAQLPSTALTMLEREEARLTVVMRHLPIATHFHAASHGRHSAKAPRRSSIDLADTPLRLFMLDGARLGSMRLVYLSACESGLAGVQRMQDEFVGLPTGFVQAGAACVIGSLWPVFDDAAFLIARKFYELHIGEDATERLPPIDALRGAQNWLRSVTFGELRSIFPVRTGSHGAYLSLQAVPRFITASLGIHLPLGPDDARPFAAPHEWAAFMVTGA